MEKDNSNRRVFAGNIFYYFTRREYNKLTNTDKGIDTPKKLPLKFGIGGATIALFPVCQPFATGYQATACLTEKVAGDESLITLGGETAFCFRGLEEKLSFFFSCRSSTCNVVAILPLQYQMDHSTSENTQQLTRQRIDQQRVVSSQGQPSTQQGVQESSTTNPLDQLHSSNKHQQVDSGEQIVAHFEQPSTSQDMQKRHTCKPRPGLNQPAAAKKVTGILKPKNVHLTPYQPFCSVCQQAVLLGENFKENSAHCTGCATTTKFTYQHLLQCVVQKTDGVVDCYLQKELLQESFPKLAAIPFDRYRQDISKIVFLLQRFQMQGTFTLAMDNCIIEVVKETNSVQHLHLDSQYRS